jgi:hypothetical protein
VFSLLEIDALDHVAQFGVWQVFAVVAVVYQNLEAFIPQGIGKLVSAVMERTIYNYVVLLAVVEGLRRVQAMGWNAAESGFLFGGVALRREARRLSNASIGIFWSRYRRFLRNVGFAY